MNPVEKRLGVVAVLLDRNTAPIDQVNELISSFGDGVIGRLGLPYPDRGVAIITLVVDMPVDRASAFTGKLGNLPGVQVKSIMTHAPEPRA